MFLTDLADIARRTGVTVVEEPGWRTRGHGGMTDVQGVVCHHTAGWNDLHVIVDGRPGLDGPLSQFWLSRTGVIHVVAAGRCWQNAPSTSPFHENHNSIGIEAENDGSAPWPAVQLDAYKRLCAALCAAYRLPAGRVKGHKEVNTSKSDPHTIDMDAFRADVARLISGEDDDVSAKEVWEKELKVPFGDKDNPEWQAGNLLVNHGVWLRKISAQVAAQDATIKALAEALAARDGAVDADALIARIRDEISHITVHLDAAPEGAPGT